MASPYEPDEPFGFQEEVVEAKKWYSSSTGVKVSYNPITRGFNVHNGRILKQSITVESGNGETYTITRNSNGVYEGDWQTSVTRLR